MDPGKTEKNLFPLPLTHLVGKVFQSKIQWRMFHHHLSGGTPTWKWSSYVEVGEVLVLLDATWNSLSFIRENGEKVTVCVEERAGTWEATTISNIAQYEKGKHIGSWRNVFLNVLLEEYDD